MRLKRVPDKYTSQIIHVGDKIDPASPPAESKFKLCHGTPVDPDTMGDYIKPNQAKTTIVPMGQEKIQVNHGHPAVSTSSTLDFPSIRSLLHPKQPALEGKEFDCHRRVVQGKSYMITSAKSLHTLLDNNVGGFVYASLHPPDSAEPFPGREDLAEWRVPEALEWDWVAKTSITDLPNGLMVVDAPREVMHGYLDSVLKSDTTPEAFGQRVGVTVYDFGVWRQKHI